jgi:hypothetical protein
MWSQKRKDFHMAEMEDRKRIARRLVENDPTLLTLEKLDTLIENIEIEYDDLQHIRYLDHLDELRKLGDDRLPWE